MQQALPQQDLGRIRKAVRAIAGRSVLTVRATGDHRRGLTYVVRLRSETSAKLVFEALKAFERPGRGPDGSPARGLGTGSRSVRVEWWDRSFSGLAALSEPPDPYWDFVQKLKRDKSDALLRRLGIRRVVKHPALGAPYGTSKPRASKGDLYAPIRAALDNAYTDPNGWVPCSERLPDLWEGVEAWAGDVYKNVWARRTTDRRFKPERVVWSVHGCTSVAAQHITHWRPKTPPPQKG